MRWLGVFGPAMALSILACAAPAPSPGQGAAGPGAELGPKRVMAAIMGEPPGMHANRNSPTLGSVPGMDVVEEIVNDGLTHYDGQGNRVPQLALAVPTLENGLWTVLPDGRMETMWTIRPDARWHDGTPFTADDLVFTARMDQDRDVGIPRNPVYDYVESVEASDPSTIVVRWNRLFIEADGMFAGAAGLPVPRHILEPAYLEDRASVMQHPYWTDAYVGTGPFVIKQWALGSHVILGANEQYREGKPRIDEIEVRFLRDVNVFIANILAGAVEMTMGRGLDPEHVVQLREQRRDLQLMLAPFSWLPLRPQFVNPNPQIITDVRMRRALIHAIDRQAIVDTIQYGMVDVAHSMINPREIDYPEIEPGVVKYAYDPRTAARLIEELGFRKGDDGFYVDAANQKLSMEMRTTAQRDQQIKATYAVANDWQRIGVNSEPYVVPLQLIPDREYRANYPAWEMVGGGSGLAAADVKRYHSSSAPLPENGYRSAGNNARYMNPELDALIDRYLSTIPKKERLGWMRQIVSHQTDQVTVMGLFYQIRSTAVTPRVINVTPGYDRGSAGWNATQWDVKGS